MTVQSHLVSLKDELVLSQAEREDISRSINTISTRINAYFGSNVIEHFKFGSQTRGTILPRIADERSDIDYIVIFKNENNYKPQTLLDQLRRFANYYYSTSSIRQSHPTMVLELNHIKFELVPAIIDSRGNILIPSRLSQFTEWIPTDPNGFNQKLTSSNVANGSRIKPLVRIMKYWNSKNGYHLRSYELEKWITRMYCYNHNYTQLKDYVLATFESLSYNWDAPQSYKNKVDNAKGIISKIRTYEASGMSYAAEEEIKKLLPRL